ncbi:MAG: stage II sporulation protein R [Lachnospiraceae bacterium]|nr:stage II sporulation protein R [Lachnospiraceae bacterium]
MKKLLFGVLIMILAVFAVLSGTGNDSEASLQEGIADKIIRFHVLANSDSEEDQQLKLKVKEHVVASIEPMIAGADSVEEVRSILSQHLEDIEAAAVEVMEQEGVVYPVQASLTNCYFPVKTYGEFTFPDGEYEALQVVIGEGQGKNWWCVMYPRLCFVDSLYSVVPEKSKKELKQELTDEEYEAILDGKRKVKIKSRLLELLGF